jgi:hypothetical protein
MANQKRRRLSILLELFLDAVLLLLFMAQAFVGSCFLIYGYLPLPTEWGNRQLAGKLPPDLILRVDAFRLRPNGSINLVGIDLKAAGIQQSLLKAEHTEIGLQWQRAFELPRIENLVLSGGTLFIPSVYSPDGYHRPLLQRVAFRLLPGESHWQVDRFAALHKDVRLRGAFQIPRGAESAGTLDVDPIVNAVYTRAAKFSQQTTRIHYFETPTVTFQMDVVDAGTQQIDLHISSRSLQHPEATAGNVQLRGSVRVQGSELTPVTAPRISAGSFELPRYGLRAEGLRATLPPDQLKGLLAGDWPQVNLAARSIDFKDFHLDAPILRIATRDFPSIDFRGATGSPYGAVQIDGRLNTELRDGAIRAQGNVDLLQLVPPSFEGKLPGITFESPPYCELHLQFKPGFDVDRAELKAQVAELQVAGLRFDHIEARASYAEGLYAIEDLYLRRNQQWLDLTFSLDSKSQDYRVSLIGSAVPYDYNALLPEWWAAIFRDFDFSQCRDSFGDFIIYGNTRRKTSDLYYGRAEAHGVRYKDVFLDQGQLIVRGRGPYTELHDLQATSGQGWARGRICFASRLDEVKGPVSVRLDLEAKLSLDQAAKLFGGNPARIIAGFETDARPLSRLRGAIFNSAYPQYAGKSFFDLSAVCDAPLRFKGIPLDHLTFDLYGRSEVTYLRNVELGYAGGQARAAIDVFTPPGQANSLRYRFVLKDAQQARALQSLPRFNQIGESLESSEPVVESAGKQARADLTLQGEGPVEDPFLHRGFGRFEIRNERLGTIQLLGPLSRILQNTQLNFTSFNLDTMLGEFRYQDEYVYFNPLQIDGPRTQIQAPGQLRLTDQSLDMQVGVSLFGNVGNPDSRLRQFRDILIKPLPNLLRFELTGTVTKQKLRSLYDPRNFIPRF